MTTRSLRSAFLFGATALTSLTVTPVFAQDSSEIEQQRGGLGDIVVTARRREESLQDTPVSVTAVNSEIIEARGIANFVDLAKITPNVKIHDTPGGIGAAAIYMRGIGYGDNIIGNDAPFGFYIDGVPFGRISTAAMDIVEPDSIQVLRGPQGTLFGRNSTGGAIVVQTHTPTDEFSGVVRGSYGSFDAVKYSARIDTGLIAGGNVKASFAYSHRQRDGIVNIRNQPDRLDHGHEEADAYWGKIQGEWGSFKATLSADYTKITGVPVPIQVVAATPTYLAFMQNSVATYGTTPLPITTRPLFEYEDYADPLPQRIMQKGVHLTLEYGLNDNLTLKGIGGLRAYRRDDTNNYGTTLKGLVNVGGVPTVREWAGWYGFTERFQKQSQKTMEVQLLGDYESLKFVIGGFYFDEDAEDLGDTRLPFAVSATTAFDSFTPRYYTVKSKSKAVFAQVDYRPPFLDNRLELTGGIRYTDDKRDFNQIRALVRQLVMKEDNVSYVLGAKFEFTDDIMAYVRYSTGYRAGGYNVRSAPPINPQYDPEKIKSLEGGFKLQALDNRLRLNVAAFYNKYDDLQVAQFAAPTGGTSGGNVNVNANAEYKGFEIEATLVPTDGLTIAGSYGYVDPKYKSFPRPAGAGGAITPGCVAITAIPGFQDCAAIQLFQNLPKTKWDASMVYEFPPQEFGVVSIGVDYSWTGKTPGVFSRVGTPFPFILDNRSYGLLGARFAVRDIPVNGDVRGSLALFGRNLTDRRYSTASIDFGYVGTQNFPERRTMGVEAKIEF
jgi:iron complex outermembrane recepter protein